MAKRRGVGLETEYSVLIAAMAIVCVGTIVLWEGNTQHAISAGGFLVVAAAWGSCAASSRNYRVNPGVVFFALCQTVMIAVLEVSRGRPTPVWLSLAVGACWLSAGWVVRTDRGSPGWLVLVFIASAVSLDRFSG
jgi:hypothetical protein